MRDSRLLGFSILKKVEASNLQVQGSAVLFFFFYCCCSVTKLCLTLCNPMDCSMSVFPVRHYLPELAQTHVHWVGDAIQPSHPLSPPSHPAFNFSQHQGLFQWVSSSHQVAKVVELQLQHQSFQWVSKVDLLQDGLVGSPCCPRDSQESSPTAQFKSINSLALILFYGPTLTSIHDFNIYFYLFYLVVPDLSCSTHIFSCNMGTLSCGMWNLVPWSNLDPLHWEYRVLATGPLGKIRVR